MKKVIVKINQPEVMSDAERIRNFQLQLTDLINRNSIDSMCNMQDFVIAEMLSNILHSINNANNEVERLKLDRKAFQK